MLGLANGERDSQAPTGFHLSIIPKTNIYGILASIMLSFRYRRIKRKKKTCFHKTVILAEG